MLWEKIKNAIFKKSCEIHDYYIVGVSDSGWYSIPSFNYELKCASCGRTKCISESDLKCGIIARIIDYDDLEICNANYLTYPQVRNKDVD